MTKLTNLGVHNVAGVTGRSYNLPCWRLSGLTILLGTFGWFHTDNQGRVPLLFVW